MRVVGMLESQTSMTTTTHELAEAAQSQASNLRTVPEHQLISEATAAAALLERLAARIICLAHGLETAEARLHYATKHTDEMRERSNTRADALRLLGWNGEGDPRDWAKTMKVARTNGQIVTAGRIACDCDADDAPPDLDTARSIMRAHGPWSGVQPETRLLVVHRMQQARPDLSLDQCAALLAAVAQETP